MITVGLGDISLTIRLSTLNEDDAQRLERVTALLKQPDGAVQEIPIPAAGLNRAGRTASVITKISQRGMYVLGARLYFIGGTSNTSSDATRFVGSDGMG